MQSSRPAATRQSGFSILELSLIILVVAALAAIGMVVYGRHRPSNAKPNTAATTQATNQHTSTLSNQTQPASPDLSIFDVLASQDPSIRWEATAAKKGLVFPYGGGVGTVTVDGYTRDGSEISQQVSASETTMAGTPENITALQKLGWQADDTLNASGVYSEGWGYIKTNGSKHQILFINSANKTATDELSKSGLGPQTPISCPCTYEYTVSLTDPF